MTFKIIRGDIRKQTALLSLASNIAFASEAKNLVSYCDKILPFPPGHYYEDGKFGIRHESLILCKPYSLASASEAVASKTRMIEKSKADTAGDLMDDMMDDMTENSIDNLPIISVIISLFTSTLRS